MTEPSVIHNTFVIERTYPTAPARVFAAFADPARKRRWFAAGDGSDLLGFEMDFRVGGTERARYSFKEGSPIAGKTLANETYYVDLVPDRRIVSTSNMTLADKLISASLLTFELLPAGDGTTLVFTHQAVFFEGSDGPQMREGGWRKLFERLSRELAG